MQQEYLFGHDADLAQHLAHLLQRRTVEPAAEETAEVVAAQVDLDRLRGLQRVGHVPQRADLPTDGTDPRLDTLDQRGPFAEDERLLAVGAHRLAGDAVPRKSGRRATATRSPRIENHPRTHTHPFTAPNLQHPRTI